jgi:hypothetical protein
VVRSAKLDDESKGGDNMKRSSFLIAGNAQVAASASLLPAVAGAHATTRTVAVTAGKPAEFRFRLLTKPPS